MNRLEQLFGEPAVLFKERINFKLPGSGGFEPHQDGQAGWEAFAPYFISVLVSIDVNTLENGCLELAAGHHTRGLIGAKWAPLSGEQLGSLTLLHTRRSRETCCSLTAMFPTSPGRNLTARPRRNLYLTYNRASDGNLRERYFIEKRKSFPPGC